MLLSITPVSGCSESMLGVECVKEREQKQLSVIMVTSPFYLLHCARRCFL